MMEKETDWNNRSFTYMVNHIVEKHHKYFKKEMTQLSMLTTTILKVHGQDHKELLKVHRIFHIIQINLVQHMIKQETNIFPVIKYYDRRPSKELLDEIFYSIDELEAIEEETKSMLKELREITNGYKAPEDGCPTYDKAYKKLKDLEANILDHDHLERDILFSRLKNKG